MIDINSYQILTAIFVGAASGYLGAFMILKRMALVGDALSHVALPGIALGLIFGFNPFFGAFAALFVGILGVWLLENRTRLSTEALVGLFFTFSLALGILLTPEPELLEALFGDISRVGRLDAILAVVLSSLVIILMNGISGKFTLGVMSEELAISQRIALKKINFLFLLLVAIIVALGIKTVGTLLMGALVIIPAITSKNLASGFSSYVLLSSIFGLLSLLGGIVLASFLSLPPGPIAVLFSAVIFAVSLVRR